MCLCRVFGFLSKSAQAQACHQVRTDAALLSIHPPSSLVVDSGCNSSLLTTEFARYAVGEAVGKDNVILLGGKDKTLNVGPTRELHIPVRDEHGRVRLFKEKASITADVRYPLLACMDRQVRLGDQNEKVQLEDVDGHKFWSPVTRRDGFAVIDVVEGPQRALITLDAAKKLTGANDKAEMLSLLHTRLAHATGRRLYLTLKEKGWGGVFTEAECKEVSCNACRLLNRKRVRVPRVNDVERTELKPGEMAYQDLTNLPDGAGGYKYVSVIVDAHTRRISAAALKSKDDAIVHCIQYVRMVEREGQRVKRWHSDNGGEFVNKSYIEFFVKEGIAHSTGAPYTPQSQGIVERANGTLKRLLGKTLRTLCLPVYTWPGLLPGVIQCLNTVVHAAHGSSPYAKAGLRNATTLPELAVGDVISVIDPKDNTAVEGYYGGKLSNQAISAIVRVQNGGWRIMRAHPTAVKVLSWPGQTLPQIGGKWETANKAKLELLSPEAPEYEYVDQDAYVENADGPIGEEEPPGNDDRQVGGADRTEPGLAKGSGIVVKRQGGPPGPAYYPAQVLRAGKRTIEAAKLNRTPSGNWEPTELEKIARTQVVKPFSLSGGEVPAELIERRQQEGVRQHEADGRPDPEQIEEVTIDDGDEPIEEVTLDESTAGALKLLAAFLPDNKSKNQIEATKAEIAKGSHVNADLDELLNFIANGALGPKVTNVTPEILERTFTAGWRRTYKGDGDDRIAKSRLYARGFEDRRDRGWVETFSGTMNHGLMRLSLVFALFMRFRACQSDVKAAFLQTFLRNTTGGTGKKDSDAKPRLYFRTPKDLPPEAKELGYEPDTVYPILRALYGLPDAPRQYTEQFKEECDSLGWKEIAESILNHSDEEGIDAVLLMHMDDLLNLALAPEEKLAEIGKRFKMGKIEMLTSDKVAVYTGLDIMWDAEKQRCTISQDRYINGIKTGLSDKDKRKRFGPSDLALTADKDVDMKYQKAQQAWTGVLGWAAKTQRQLSVVFAETSRNSTRPSAESVKAAMRACEYAKATSKPMLLEAVSKPVLVMWVDASYSIYTCDGRLGWELQVIDEKDLCADIAKVPDKNVISWRSIRSERKLASTTSAELCALLEGVKAIPAYVGVCKKLWGDNPKVIFVTDNQPLLGWLRTGWCDADSHMQGTLELVRSRIDYMDASVLWVATADQRADKHTKFVYSG